MSTSSPGTGRRPADVCAAAGGALGHQLSGRLLEWYDANRRSLPWRPLSAEQRDPYATWLSEIMLQQTRVQTVIPYFLAFRERYPTVLDLARAPLDDVLVAWSGLGYYRRARNLHAAARQIVQAGTFPDTLVGLRLLPGVGPYVAGAVASMAFGLDTPAVDGNVERVLSRVWAHAGTRTSMGHIAGAMMPAGRAGDFNQALMDLGSSVCRPRQPRCDECPLAAVDLVQPCLAQLHGDQQRFPLKKAKRTIPTRRALAMVMERRGQVLLSRRPASGLFGGLYELPGDFLLPEESLQAGVSRVSQARLGRSLQAGRELGRVAHTLTHMKLELHVVEALSDGPALLAEEADLPQEALLDWYTGSTWVVPQDPGELGLSTLARRSLAVVAAAWSARPVAG